LTIVSGHVTECYDPFWTWRSTTSWENNRFSFVSSPF